MCDGYHGHFDRGARHRLTVFIDYFALDPPALRERRHGGAEQHNRDQSRDMWLTPY